jgi:hypothetical protein
VRSRFKLAARRAGLDEERRKDLDCGAFQPPPGRGHTDGRHETPQLALF